MRFEVLKNHPKLPKHIGMILDGNGRWAKKRGLPRSAGHKVGFETLKKQVEYVKELGVKNLSLFCFSKENWGRSEKEVKFLMDLFDTMLTEFENEYVNSKSDVRVMFSGDLDDSRLPNNIGERAKDIMKKTQNNTGFVLNACINYGGRQEILMAINNIINNKETQVDEKLFESYLYTADLLPLDLIIRTSGENRTSNFMPWQSTYSEWYFTKTLWPDFNKKDLAKAVLAFTKRNRRYGEIKE